MDDMKIYIANLGKYTEGELVGAWFNVPVNFEEVKEKIGLNDEYEEYAIHDYELPFEIGEYESLEEINRRCKLLEDIPSYMLNDLKELLGAYSDIDEFIDNLDDIVYYSGCESMEALARRYAEEGNLGEIPENLIDYIDYVKVGSDMAIRGHYVIGSSGIYKCPM